MPSVLKTKKRKEYFKSLFIVGKVTITTKPGPNSKVSIHQRLCWQVLFIESMILIGCVQSWSLFTKGNVNLIRQRSQRHCKNWRMTFDHQTKTNQLYHVFDALQEDCASHCHEKFLMSHSGSWVRRSWLHFSMYAQYCTSKLTKMKI